MKKIIFLCTGNTCRSPMAEGIYNSLSKGAISRGIMACDGEGASENAVKAMAKMGIDISNHVAHRIKRSEIEESDLVLTMTAAQKNAILSVMPTALAKVFSVGEFIGGEDIKDPYGGDEKIYDECAKQLYEYIERIVEKLK